MRPARIARHIRHKACRPLVERVEDRLLMAVFTVTSANDSGPGTLRAIIQTADVTPGLNTIRFAIGTGAQTISPASPLPVLTNPTIIDGTSQPGASGRPSIEINGAGAGPGAEGLVLAAGGGTIQGLTIDGFSGAQVHLTGLGGDTVAGNFIGTDPTGSFARGGAGPGLLVATDGNTIGGFSLADGNVIAGNAGDGITLLGSNNRVLHNEIGTNSGASRAVPNGGNGITVAGGTGNTIGGVTAGAGNVVSGNRHDGILILTGGNVVQGNLIGTGAGGTTVISNGGDGLAIVAAGTTAVGGNLLGGSVAPAANVIAGNAGNGILISGPGAQGNVIAGNAVGTSAGGTRGLGNARNGVLLINGASNNLIGGLTPALANAIAANQGDGVRIDGGAGNVLVGNFIGTGPSGGTPLGNEGNGVFIAGDGNAVGGTNLAAGNVVRYNDLVGVRVASGRHDSILTNSIFGNAGLGIALDPPANGPINAPVLTSAVQINGRTIVRGTLKNVARTPYLIQFFANTAPDPSGFGQGQTFLGAIRLTTHAGGGIHFEAVFNTAVVAGQFLTATATDPANDTSAFSNALKVLAPAVAARTRTHQTLADAARAASGGVSPPNLTGTTTAVGAPFINSFNGSIIPATTAPLSALKAGRRTIHR